MKTRLKFFAVAVLALIVLPFTVLLAAGLWYRLSDHGPALLAEHCRLSSVEEQPLGTDSSGLAEIAFTLTDERGRRTTGRLRFPETAVKPLPALLVLGGQYTGARAARLVTLEREAVLCAIDYPPVRLRKIEVSRLPGTLFRLNRAVRDAVGMSFSALDYLWARPEVDTSRITVLGASFGAPFAVIASLDRRVRATVLVQGAAGLETVIDWNLRKRIRPALVRRPVSFLLGTLTAPFEPASYIGRLAPRPLLLVNSTGDEKIPVSCVEKLYGLAGPPREQIWIDSGHLHPSRHELIDSLTGLVSDWLVKQDLL